MPRAATFTLRYEITAESVVDMRHAHRATVYRLTVLAFGFITLSAVALVLGGVLLKSPDLAWSGLFLLAPAAALWLNVNRSIAVLIMRRKAAPLLGVTHEMAFDAHGITYRSAGTSSRVAWSFVTELREQFGTVLFLKGRVVAGWVPAYAFANAAQQEKILAFARERIAAARGNTDASS